MKVKRLQKTSNRWQLQTQGGQSLGPFDVVIGGFAQHCLTDPFLASGGQACKKMLQCLRRLESNQIIAIQVSFEGESILADFTAAHVYEEDCLSFVCNNSKKPQQSGQLGTPGPQHWTLLSTASFAEREFNTNPKGYRRSAEKKMLGAFANVLGISDLSKHKPVVNRINHWEDGLPSNTPPNSRGCLFDADNSIGWCGDFCVMPGIEGAALSGQAMAQTILDFLANSTDFNRQGFLPADDQWVEFQLRDVTMVDIGAFSSSLALKRCWTHTDLVPSAIDGYDQKAHTGAAGASIGKGGKKGKYTDNYGQKGKGYRRNY